MDMHRNYHLLFALPVLAPGECDGNHLCSGFGLRNLLLRFTVVLLSDQ